MKTKKVKNSRAWTPERRKRQAATIAARQALKAHVRTEREANRKATQYENWQNRLVQSANTSHKAKSGDAIFQHNQKTGWAAANTEANSPVTPTTPKQPNPYHLAEVYVLRAATRLDSIIEDQEKNSETTTTLALRYIRDELCADARRVKQMNPDNPKE